MTYSSSRDALVGPIIRLRRVLIAVRRRSPSRVSRAYAKCRQARNAAFVKVVLVPH